MHFSKLGRSDLEFNFLEKKKEGTRGVPYSKEQLLNHLESTQKDNNAL